MTTAELTSTPGADAAEGRRLVSVERIAAIRPIPNADAIEQVTVRGWNVVVKKDEFRVGDPVLYFEIDSLLPLADERFAFLAPRGERVVDGVRRHRLKTARLRGVYSQGLVLPAALFLDVLDGGLPAAKAAGTLQERLGIIKYEPPVPAGTGQLAGPFPTHLARKTDSERVQNLTAAWDEIAAAGPWLATEKIDGTSCTVIRDADGTLHVCGRNWEISEGDNIYWGAVRQLLGATIADESTEEGSSLLRGEGFQMEIYGEGVQANPLRVKGKHVAVFAYQRDGRTLPREQWPQWALKHAPALYDLPFPGTPAEAIEQVDGIMSLISPNRLAEGIVWHRANGEPLACLDYRSTWKAISNRFLLKSDS